MKKRKLLYAALFLSIAVALSSCFHDHDISISVNDDEEVYKMRASFNEDRTRTVERIINAHLNQHPSLSFKRGFVDTVLTLDDGTRFHIKARPGKLRINFDKTEISAEGCERLKEICEEIKEALAEEEYSDN